MLREISQKDALFLFLDGADVKILKPGTNTGKLVLYTLQELLDGCKYLIENKAMLKESEVKGMSTEEFSALLAADLEADRKFGYDTEEGKEEKSKRGRARKGRIDYGKVEALRKAKWKIADIAEELSCSEAAIYRYLRNRE